MGHLCEVPFLRSEVVARIWGVALVVLLALGCEVYRDNRAEGCFSRNFQGLGFLGSLGSGFKVQGAGFRVCTLCEPSWQEFQFNEKAR